jgi:shikimate dehydrogenase
MVVARRVDKARELARQFKSIEMIDLNADASDLPDVDLVVNATPVGMAPEVDRSPWPHQWPLPRHAAFFDLVYNPRQTKLVRDARAQGLSATTGLRMLVEQAALAYEIWTGCQTQRDILLSAAENK